MPEDKQTAIKEAIFKGRKIEAIKLYRDATGAGLKEAKDAVEKLEGELKAASPDKFSKPSSKGCLGSVAIVCALFIAAVLWMIRK
jgi:hypothetical protein